MDIINIIHEPAICTTSFGYLLALFFCITRRTAYYSALHRNPFLPLSFFRSVNQTHSFEDIYYYSF